MAADFKIACITIQYSHNGLLETSYSNYRDATTITQVLQLWLWCKKAREKIQCKVHRCIFEQEKRVLTFVFVNNCTLVSLIILNMSWRCCTFAFFSQEILLGLWRMTVCTCLLYSPSPIRFTALFHSLVPRIKSSFLPFIINLFLKQHLISMYTSFHILVLS